MTLHLIDKDIIDSYLGGNGSSKIAKKYGCSNVSILNILRRNGVEIRSRYPNRNDVTIDDVRNLFYCGYTMIEIAEELNCSLYIIRLRLKEAGINAKSETNIKEIIRLYNKGVGTTHISKIFRISSERVRRILDDNNIKRRTLNRHKLGTQEISRIKNLKKEGKSLREIAKLYGISFQAVYYHTRNIQ